MDKDNVVDLLAQARALDPLTDMLRKGARELIAQAIEAEPHELLEQFKDTGQSLEKKSGTGFTRGDWL